LATAMKRTIADGEDTRAFKRRTPCESAFSSALRIAFLTFTSLEEQSEIWEIWGDLGTDSEFEPQNSESVPRSLGILKGRDNGA